MLRSQGLKVSELELFFGHLPNLVLEVTRRAHLVDKVSKRHKGPSNPIGAVGKEHWHLGTFHVCFIHFSDALDDPALLARVYIYTIVSIIDANLLVPEDQRVDPVIAVPAISPVRLLHEAPLGRPWDVLLVAEHALDVYLYLVTPSDHVDLTFA